MKKAPWIRPLILVLTVLLSSSLLSCPEPYYTGPPPKPENVQVSPGPNPGEIIIEFEVPAMNDGGYSYNLHVTAQAAPFPGQDYSTMITRWPIEPGKRQVTIGGILTGAQVDLKIQLVDDLEYGPAAEASITLPSPTLTDGRLDFEMKNAMWMIYEFPIEANEILNFNFDPEFRTDDFEMVIIGTDGSNYTMAEKSYSDRYDDYSPSYYSGEAGNINVILKMNNYTERDIVFHKLDSSYLVEGLTVSGSGETLLNWDDATANEYRINHFHPVTGEYFSIHTEHLSANLSRGTQYYTSQFSPIQDIMVTYGAFMQNEFCYLANPLNRVIFQGTSLDDNEWHEGEISADFPAALYTFDFDTFPHSGILFEGDDEHPYTADLKLVAYTDLGRRTLLFQPLKQFRLHPDNYESSI
jgi:hypothetical protein